MSTFARGKVSSRLFIAPFLFVATLLFLVVVSMKNNCFVFSSFSSLIHRPKLKRVNSSASGIFSQAGLQPVDISGWVKMILT